MDAEPPPTDFDGPSVRALINQLIADTRDYARAEMEFVRAEVGDRTSHIGPAVGLMAGAAVLLFAALIAALVGITFWIGLAIGLGWAILIVTITVAVIAYGLVRVGQRHLQQVTRPWEKP
jgi:Putative Actinobacterial Holin-X, holin superfamily III